MAARQTRTPGSVGPFNVLNAHTTERTDKKGGKVVTTLKRVVSQDGKTMTVTTKGTNAEGQATNNVILFEKQ